MIEEAFLRDMERNGLRATRSFSFQSYTIDEESKDPNAHPVTVELIKGPTSEGGSNEGKVVTVRCKYLVGCDGGRSAVRHFGIDNHGLSFDGELLSTLWGAGDFGRSRRAGICTRQCCSS
jgi:2-polyprenyl-6-methoxyphenol hydroxylase-like FAD-dependent oxidoreductase